MKTKKTQLKCEKKPRTDMHTLVQTRIHVHNYIQLYQFTITKLILSLFSHRNFTLRIVSYL